MRDKVRRRVERNGLLIAALLLFAPSLASASQAASATTTGAGSQGPSFSCAKQSEIEALICTDPVLSAADRRLASFYEIAKAGALGTGSNQLAAQRSWLKQRDQFCNSPKLSPQARRNCIATAYDERLEQLAIATLLTDPKDSMAELARLQPKAAPLYRATYDFASIGDDRRRADVVAADLAPIYAAMDANTREHLSPEANETLTTAREAAASDSNFATFFAVFATLELEGGNVTWPCAALVKRPGLIAGLGSHFGGAIDGAIPGSDCDTTLPPTNEVSELSMAAQRAQPFEQGTIRFSVGRDYVQLEDAVRLHLANVWQARARNNNTSPSPRERAWRRSHQEEIEKDRAALAAYYAKYFNTPSKTANKDAANAIDTLIHEAFTSYND